MFKRFYTTLLFMSLSTGLIIAQSLTEKKDVRFYEHHSPSPMATGIGSKSGYDFMNHTYVSLFDPEASSGSGAYPEGSTVPINIDMAERVNNNQRLGFTSGNSYSWGPPYIRGNGLTRYMPAPEGFDYNQVSTMIEIKNAYDDTKASITVDEAISGDIYLVKLRNSDIYLVMKIKIVQNPDDINEDKYFSFNYKYPTGVTSIKEIQCPNKITIYPNPTQSIFSIDMGNIMPQVRIRLLDVLGREVISVSEKSVQKISINVQHLKAGSYLVETVTDNERHVTRIQVAN